MEVMIIEDRGDYNELRIVEVCGPERLYEAVQAQVTAAYKSYRIAERSRIEAERYHRERSFQYWNDGKSDDDGDYGRHMADANASVARAVRVEEEAKAAYDELWEEFAELIPPSPPLEAEFDLDSFEF
ncbi:MAG TPA: hypothetical protein PLQ71_12435 [Nitrospira sp.]|nr:hypothetical protein [Rhodocyclaceae bacterium]HNG02687.1 hypothetical protein [Nitrospira sp.]